MARNYGTQNVYDYVWASGYQKYINAMRYRPRQILTIDADTPEGIENVKRYLCEGHDGRRPGGILTYSTYITNAVFNDSYSGPSETGYRHLLTGLANTGPHALTIVGYDDTVEYAWEGETHYGAFIIADTNGPTLHDRGRFYLPYDFFMIDRTGMNPNLISETVDGVIPEIHEPKIVFKVKVKYTSRQDLSFILGVADKPYAQAPTITSNAIIMNNQGGDHPMQGSGRSSEMEVAFSFTKMLEDYSSFTEPKYFLNVVRSGGSGSGTIEHFSVADYRQYPGNLLEYVCTEIDANELTIGSNLYGIATTPIRTTCASPIQIVDSRGNVSSNPYVVNTAKGKKAKVQFVGYDRETGKITMQYYYQPNGGIDISTQ